MLPVCAQSSSSKLVSLNGCNFNVCRNTVLVVLYIGSKVVRTRAQETLRHLHAQVTRVGAAMHVAFLYHLQFVIIRDYNITNLAEIIILTYRQNYLIRLMCNSYIYVNTDISH